MDISHTQAAQFFRMTKPVRSQLPRHRILYIVCIYDQKQMTMRPLLNTHTRTRSTHQQQQNRRNNDEIWKTTTPQQCAEEIIYRCRKKNNKTRRMCVDGQNKLCVRKCIEILEYYIHQILL